MTQKLEKQTPIFETLVEDRKGFHQLAQILKNKTGIDLPESDKNLSLMAGRSLKILQEFHLESYDEIFQAISIGDPRITQSFINALTTNKTDFFREPQHFDRLKKYLDAYSQKRPMRHLRIWCTAASTGEEPYSIALTIAQCIPNWEHWPIHFLATDINRSVLGQASKGVFSEKQMAGIPPFVFQQAFTRIKEDKTEARFVIREPFRNLIRFAPFNLVDSYYPFEHKFDIIFCRNVLIYFDQPTCEKVVNNLANSLSDGGLLFIGHAETGVPKPKNLKSVQIAVYQKQGGNP